VRSRLLLVAAAAALLAGCVAIAAPATGRERVSASACPQVDALPAALNDATVGAAVLCLLNAARRDRGLMELRPNPRLARAAVQQAQDMVRRRYFAHRNPDGAMPSDRIRATGYLHSSERWTVGENLAWGTGSLTSARGLVGAWMSSPDHRANILKAAYRDIGIGIALGTPVPTAAPGATVATTFGVVR
jgi:uncharacterized protein YkwD